MAEPAFFEPCRGSRAAHDVRADLPGGVALRVTGLLPVGAVELCRTCADSLLSFRMDGAEAYALGVELMAAAVAVGAGPDSADTCTTGRG
jgi:hypothetical protein